MFKRIAISTMILGAAISIAPALASAQGFDRGHDRDRELREARERREYQQRFRDDRFRGDDRRFYERNYYDRSYYDRGYYDRFGCWHRY